MMEPNPEIKSAAIAMIAARAVPMSSLVGDS